MKKLLTYLGILAALILVLGIAAYYIAKKNEPEVRRIVVNEINRHLKVPVKVADINLSLLQRFPYASIRFSNVVIPEIIDGQVQEDTLIYIEDLYFQIGLLSFLRKNYEITEAEVINGFFDMKTFENGKENYRFWKSAEDSTGGAADMCLTEIVFEDFIYRLSTSGDLKIDVFIEDMVAEGNFGSTTYEIETDGRLIINSVVYEDAPYYLKEEVEGKLRLQIDDNDYSFYGSSFSIANQELEIEGAYRPNDPQNWVLDIKAEKGNIDKLLHLIPERVRSNFTKYRARGSSDISVNLSAGKRFDLKAGFDNLSGSFQHNEALGTAEIDAAAGELTITNGIVSLSLDRMTASIGPGELSAWGRIIDFDAPSFDLNLEGTLDLEELKSLLNIELVELLEGEVYLDGRLQGTLPRKSPDETLALLKGIDFIGKIEVENGSMKMKDQDQTYDRITGNLQLKDNAIIVDEANARVNENSFKISGRIENALPYIANPGEKLSIKAAFSAGKLDFNKILTSQSTSRDTLYNFELPEDVSFDLTLNIEEISFRAFSATDIEGKAYYKSGLLTLNPFKCSTSGGNLWSNSSIERQKDGNYNLKTTVEVENMELSSLFTAFEDFGQQVVSHKNIEGKANAEVELSAQFRSDLDMDPRSVVAKINLVVTNGRLKNVTSLQDISDYLRENALWRSMINVDAFEKKLTNIAFDTLQNRISIANNTINIPQMTIGSSALRLNLQGTHSFNNEIDYTLSFRLSELLRTGKKEQSEFGYIVDDGSGLRLFMKMEGTVDNPRFSLDKDAAREKRKREFDNEKDTFKSILKEEFGFFKNDTTLKDVPNSKEKSKPRFSVDVEDFKSKNDSTEKAKNGKKNKKNDKRDDLFEDDDL